MNAEYELTTCPDVSANLRECIRACLFSCADNSVTQEDLIVIELAVSEAASNIYKHAYGSECGKPMWLRISLSGPDLEIRLSHLGEPPDLSKVPEPVFDGTKESGFGIFIMRQCMDAVDYGADNLNRPCVSLRKHLGGGRSEDGTQG